MFYEAPSSSPEGEGKNVTNIIFAIEAKQIVRFQAELKNCIFENTNGLK